MSQCYQPVYYVTDNTDCDDNDSEVRPGESASWELCNGKLDRCEDDDGNDIDGCDWDETDEAACTAAGGDYDNGEECSVWTFTKN